MIFTVTKETEGQRLDTFLRNALDSSRRDILRLLNQNCVSLNGHGVTYKAKGLALELGTEVSIKDFTHLTALIPNHKINLSILVAAEGYILVDKPAGMPVLPLHHSEDTTVLNAIKARYPGMQGVGEGGLKSGVVHRLDTDTSGVLAVATNDPSWQRLRAAFSQHRTQKIYHAIVYGTLHGEGREAMYLLVAKHHPAHVRVVEWADLGAEPQARHCRLSWRVLEPLRKATLIEVQLETGFLHQIRAMFARKGHPVIGDKRYGSEAPDLNAPRHMLHAAQLTIEDISATSPLPEDFIEVLGRLRG